MLRHENNIEYLTAERKNDIATFDAAILKLRRALTRSRASPRRLARGSWAQELEAATQAYNETPHGAIYDEAPEKVSGNSEESKSLHFDLQQQNAEKFARQSEVSQKKVEKLEEATAFRVQIKQRQGTGLKCRGFKPTYEKERIALTGIDQNSGNVRGVGPDGKAVNEAQHLRGGLDERARSLRDRERRATCASRTSCARARGSCETRCLST
jgi:hypothetical protein